VEKLPDRIGISPHPEYVCENCGKKMRAPGSLITYMVALLLGGAVAVLFVVVGLQRDDLNLQGFLLAGLGLVCCGYSFLQLMKPTPRRRKNDDDWM
jgi:hypothetical protein